MSCHACGALTDSVLDAAAAARARVAVLPCCHDASASDTGGLSGWLDDALANVVAWKQRVGSRPSAGASLHALSAAAGMKG